MNAVHSYLPDLLLALSAMTLALMSPGPNILAVIGTSMETGRRSGIALALGIACGTFLWATLAVLGLAALLTAYAGAVNIIRVVGGGYLIYLGWRALRSAASTRRTPSESAGRPEAASACFGRGLTVQMTNPKAALAMTAIVTLGIGEHAPAWVGAALVVGITLLSAVGHLVYAIAFSTRRVADAYARARRPVEAILGVFFCLAGAKLLLDRS